MFLVLWFVICVLVVFVVMLIDRTLIYALDMLKSCDTRMQEMKFGALFSAESMKIKIYHSVLYMVDTEARIAARGRHGGNTGKIGNGGGKGPKGLIHLHYA